MPLITGTVNGSTEHLVQENYVFFYLNLEINCSVEVKTGENCHNSLNLTSLFDSNTFKIMDTVRRYLSNPITISSTTPQLLIG